MPSEQGPPHSASRERSESFHSHPLADHLAQWFCTPENGGSLHHGLRLVHSPSRGFHARAATSLASPTVATCPLSLSLSYLSLDHAQHVAPHVVSPLQRCLGRIPNHVLTYLLLIEQRGLGRDSFWHPYIACLPKEDDLTTTLWFSEDDFIPLRGSNLLDATKQRLHKLIAEHHAAVREMRDAGIDEATRRKYDLESFKWAATIMSSRSFISRNIFPDIQDDFSILFPVIDMLNHKPRANVVWHMAPNAPFSLELLGDFEPGDELCNNYAPKGNDELLMGYGFCIPDNPFEQVTVRLGRLPHTAREWWTPDCVPYGMDPAFLGEETASVSSFFLRTKGHPFGLYRNKVPVFRSFPPHLVFILYLTTIESHGLSPEDENRGPHEELWIVLKILLNLYHMVLQRCRTYANRPLLSRPNAKQRMAQMYMDGQEKMTKAIAAELRDVFGRRRRSASSATAFVDLLTANQSTQAPILLTTPEAFAALTADFSAEYTALQQAISDVWGFDVASDADATTARNAEVWVLMLYFCFVVSHSQDPADTKRAHMLNWRNALLDYDDFATVDWSKHAVMDAPELAAVDRFLETTAAGRRGSVWKAIWDWGPAMRKKVLVWAVHAAAEMEVTIPELEDKGVVVTGSYGNVWPSAWLGWEWIEDEERRWGRGFC